MLQCTDTWRPRAGACHYAKDSGDFGRKSNGKVRFGSFRPKYSGSLLEVVHLFLSNRSAWNFAVPFLQVFDKPTSPHLCWEFGKEKKNGKSHSSWPGLIGKCRSIFLGYSHWSLTGRFGLHNESTPHARGSEWVWINTIFGPIFGFFGGESFGAPGSRLGLADSQKSLPQL